MKYIIVCLLSVGVVYGGEKLEQKTPAPAMKTDELAMPLLVRDVLAQVGSWKIYSQPTMYSQPRRSMSRDELLPIRPEDMPPAKK
jgi:hypothetical protein